MTGPQRPQSNPVWPPSDVWVVQMDYIDEDGPGFVPVVFTDVERARTYAKESGPKVTVTVTGYVLNDPGIAGEDVYWRDGEGVERLDRPPGPWPDALATTRTAPARWLREGGQRPPR